MSPSAQEADGPLKSLQIVRLVRCARVRMSDTALLEVEVGP
jgi:hypothetical protein